MALFLDHLRVMRGSRSARAMRSVVKARDCLAYKSFINKRISVVIAVLLTSITILCLLYVFLNQEPVLKLEYGMDSIMMVLLITEMFYGAFVFMPCCNKPVID
uniref:Uncharacterized protein n=1 Tax=Photinus pyralis TaxID=7054 RepID=A0A1Y1MUQ3_PHOPY